MPYRALADAVLILHAVFIAFVLLGGLLALRLRWLPWLHLPAVLWVILIELNGWICPLTPIENRLLEAGGRQGYSGGFVEHYLLALIYPAGLTPRVQVLFAAIVAGFNLAVYTLLWRRRGRATRT